MNTKNNVRDIEDIVIEESHQQHAIRTAEALMSRFDGKRMPGSMLMTGYSGLGKSTVINELKRLHPDSDLEFKLGIRKLNPIISASLPSQVSPKILVAEILRVLGDRFPENGSLESLTSRLLNTTLESSTRLIILDEFHHLFGVGSLRQQSASLPIRGIHDWIKLFMDKSKVSFLLSGLPKCEDLMHFDSQIARRFDINVRLMPFSLAEGAALKSYTNFLTRFYAAIVDLNIGIEEVVDFGELPLSNLYRLHAATNGYVDQIKKLHVGACTHALADNRSVVTLEDFAKSFVNVPWRKKLPNQSRVVINNPFTDSMQTIRAYVGYETSLLASGQGMAA